jgi:hypothetical protein
MQRWFLGILTSFALGLCPLWSGCATQEDSVTQPVDESTGATAAGGYGGQAGTPTAGGKSAAAGAPSGGGAGSNSVSGGNAGMTASAGTAPIAGTLPGAGGASDASNGGAGGEGSDSCNTATDCDDKNVCTTDTCLLEHCSYTSNVTACADDNDPCTADICAVGACTHTDNKTCECKKDADCDDKKECTDDHCVANKCTHANNTAACTDDGMSCTLDVCAAGACTHKDNGSCGVGVPFTVDSFNSSADWLVAKTSPDQRAITVTGINASNLEGNADLWIAEADTGTIEFALASLVGLGKLRVVIRSVQAGTGGMVFVGTWNGTAWSDKALGGYAAIPTANYATIEIPTADFGQVLGDVTKLRLRFAVTGGEKTWQIDEIAAAK